MERIVAQSSRLRLFVLALAGACFVAGGVFLLAVDKSPEGTLVGWMSIVFFGGCTLVFVWQLFDTRPRLIIDDRGVWDRALKVGVVEWHDISDAYVKHIQGNPFVCIALRDPTKYTRRLSPLLRRMASLNRALGFTELSLNLTGTDLDAEQIRELIVKEMVVRRGRLTTGWGGRPCRCRAQPRDPRAGPGVEGISRQQHVLRCTQTHQYAAAGRAGRRG